MNLGRKVPKTADFAERLKLIIQMLEEDGPDEALFGEVDVAMVRITVLRRTEQIVLTAFDWEDGLFDPMNFSVVRSALGSVCATSASLCPKDEGPFDRVGVTNEFLEGLGSIALITFASLLILQSGYTKDSRTVVNGEEVIWLKKDPTATECDKQEFNPELN